MSNNRRPPDWPVQMAEMALAVPQVVAHRVARMALAGHSPSARDRREFHLMGAEKAAAFYESWWAMGMQLWAAQQQVAASLLRQAWSPWWAMPLAAAGRGRRRAGPLSHHAAHPIAQAGAVLTKGLAPVHRRAVANARRLARTPLRPGGPSSS